MATIIIGADDLIARSARDVFIDATALKKVAKQVIHFAQWLYEKRLFAKVGNFFEQRLPKNYPCSCESNGLDWLFVLHMLNFSLWIPNSKKQWTVNGLTGFHALCAAIKRAIEEGNPMWDPSYYSSLSLDAAEIIFRSDNEIAIPLLYERIRLLHQAGHVLLNHYQGSFRVCIRLCGFNPFRLIVLLNSQFESYRDVSYYFGCRVFLGNKAITLVAEVCSFVEQMTDKKNLFPMQPLVFANRTTQILYHCGILHYSDELLSRLEQTDRPLEYGERVELEIRACSMNATKVLCDVVLMQMECVTTQMPFLKTLEFNVAILVSNYLLYYELVHDKTLRETISLNNVISIYY